MARPSAQHRALLLEYPLHLCPANGVALLRLLAGPIPGWKEAAGHAFHAAALQQRGVAGEFCPHMHGTVGHQLNLAYILPCCFSSQCTDKRLLGPAN